MVGLLITASVSWTAWAINRHTEHRLLEVQTRQVAAVLESTILNIRDPLDTGLQIAVATGGGVGQFDSYIATYTGPKAVFVSTSLWRLNATSSGPVATVGDQPGLSPTSGAARAFVESALHSKTFVVTSVSANGSQRIGYAIADPRDPEFVVYAERAIPRNRQVSVESNAAFADLNYATYLGPTLSLTSLATTDVPLSRLPLSGNTAREAIPFGNTTLTIVTSPRGQLGGSLGRQLPLILLVGGGLLSLATSGAATQLIRRRRYAESDARTITGLYNRLDNLYIEQRTIAETLQRALLPASNPSIPQLEIACRYVAGTAGVDVGGDWYSVDTVDEQHFAFVVGDVSGRGLSAAVVMARLRFTLRAYLLEGHSPNTALAMCSRHLDINNDGHISTVLVGLANLQTREITLANAGHPSPLIISAAGSAYVSTLVGPPLGIEASGYETSTFSVPPDGTVLAFTDGLVERRGESIDDGLQRLADAARTDCDTLEHLLTSVVAAMAHDGPEDDIAILAFRWLRPA